MGYGDMADFPTQKISINYKSTDYGPFNFDLEDAIPTGLTISDVTLKSYLGRVNEGDDLDDETDTTSECVDSTLTAVNGNYTVDAYFNYPSTSAYQNQLHTLIFEITFSGNGGTHAYYHYYLDVN